MVIVPVDSVDCQHVGGQSEAAVLLLCCSHNTGECLVHDAVQGSVDEVQVFSASHFFVAEFLGKAGLPRGQH